MMILLILVVLAVVVGIGAVIEGLFWMFLIGIGLLVAAAWFGLTKVRGTTRT